MIARGRALALLLLSVAAVGGLTFGALRDDTSLPTAKDAHVRVVLLSVAAAPDGGARVDVLVGNADGSDEHVESRFSGFDFHALRADGGVLRGEVFGARHEAYGGVPGDALRFTVDFPDVPLGDLDAVALTYTPSGREPATLWVHR